MTQSNIFKIILLLCFLTVAGRVSAFPFELNYGGRLTDQAGNPIAGPIDVQFKFYRSESGTEDEVDVVIPEITGVILQEGLFNVNIQLPAAQFHTIFDSVQPAWIELTDVTNTQTYPRQKFSTIPYALKTPVDNQALFYNSEGVLTLKKPSQLDIGYSDSDFFVSIKAPDGLSASSTFVLPSNQGSAGQVLTIDDSGNTSWSTIVGTVGPQGPAGTDGTDGVDGVQGLKGDTGEKGDTGGKGDPGEKGLKGDTGPAGPIGPAGSAGLVGLKGDTGPAGLKGDTGPAGPLGAIGSYAITRLDKTCSYTDINTHCGSRGCGNHCGAADGNISNQVWTKMTHLSWVTIANSNTGLFSIGTNGVVTVSEAGTYTLQLNGAAHRTSAGYYTTMIVCPYINGTPNCRQQSGHQFGAWAGWHHVKTSYVIQLNAGDTISYGYYPFTLADIRHFALAYETSLTLVRIR